MILSFNTIALLLLALLATHANLQDVPLTTPTPAPTHVATPTPPPEPQLAPSNPPSTQTHPNSANLPSTPQVTTQLQNIVTTEIPAATPAPQEQHHENAVNAQPHAIQSEVTAQHHESQSNQNKPQISREDMKKALQEMTEEQLKTFENSLQGEAREYYDQLLKQEVKQEQQEEVEYQEQYQQVEPELTKTDKEFAKEQEEFNSQKDKTDKAYINYNEYLFELDQGNNQDFRIAIPNAQQIIFYGYTYENNEGTYSVTSNVEDQQPISIIIYENNHRIIYQKTFYFKYFGSYLGNDNCSYLIRFINPSQHKLIALNIGIMFEHGHAVDKLTVHDVADHGRRLEVFRNDVANKYTDMSMKSVIENENRQSLISKLDHYFAYSIIEIVVILVLCVLQVESVKKLLASTNIV